MNNLIKKVQAKVVITSTWRVKHLNSELKGILREAGLIADIVGFTPDFKSFGGHIVRGNEILKWCMDNEVLLECKWREYHDFVIIDDGNDFLLWQSDNFFRTDRFCGLTLTVKREIQRFFSTKRS